MYAHCTKVKGGFEVTICASMSPRGGVVFKVASKKEARQIAAAHNAAPWNF
jgi:hypothetical protein